MAAPSRLLGPRQRQQAAAAWPGPALLADAHRGLFDIALVWRFDRFARSVKQLVLALEEFRSLGIDFVSHQEALDTSTRIAAHLPRLPSAEPLLDSDDHGIWAD